MAKMFLTLADLGKLWDPDGKLGFAQQVDMTWQANELLQVLPWVPCNDKTKHMVLQRVGLPTVYETMLHGGTLPSTGVDAQMWVPTAYFTSLEEIPKKLADLSGDAEGLRWQRSRGHYEAHAQNMASTMFYGNTLTDPDSMPGLSFMYSSTTKNNSQNIILGGGAGGDNASMWLIGFGTDAISGLYPANTMAGLEHIYAGECWVENAGGAVGGTLTLKRELVYRDHYSWMAGVLNANWKWAVRICNISVNNLVSGINDANLIQLGESAVHRLPTTAVRTPDPNSPVRRIGWFMNRTLREMVDRQSRQQVAAGGQLRYEVVDGIQRQVFHSIPMYTMDQLTNSEALVA